MNQVSRSLQHTFSSSVQLTKEKLMSFLDQWNRVVDCPVNSRRLLISSRFRSFNTSVTWGHWSVRHFLLWNHFRSPFVALTCSRDLTHFTLSNARRFYLSPGKLSWIKGLTTSLSPFTTSPSGQKPCPNYSFNSNRLTRDDFTCDWGTSRWLMG